MSRQSSARVCRLLGRLAFFALIVLSPFRGRIRLVSRLTPPVYADFTDFLLSAGDIAMLATVTFWLASVVLDGGRPSFGPKFVAWPVAVLLVVAALGIPFSTDPSLSAYATTRYVILAAFALYVVNEVTRLQELILPISAMVAVQAVVGIGQVIAQRSLSLGGLGEHVLSPSLGVSVIGTAAGDRILRAYGLTDHPNILGGLMVMALLVLAGAFVAARLVDSPRALAAPLSLVVIASAAACALLTFSRGAWIAAVLGLAILAAMVAVGRDRRGWRDAAIAIVAVGFGVAPFLAPYHEAFAARTDRSSAISTETRSINEREVLNKAVSRVVSDHPLLGVGIGALPLALRDAEPDFRYDYQPAASVLLDVTAETGVIGGIAYLVILVAPWIAMLRVRRSWTAELAGASAALAAVTIVGVVDYYVWSYPPGQAWAWLILGLWAGAYQRSRAGGASDVSGATRG